MLFQEVDRLDDLVPIGVHIRLGVPQHVDQLLVILFVHGDVLAQLGIKPEVGYANGAAPGASSVHHSSIGAGGLVHQEIAWKSHTYL